MSKDEIIQTLAAMTKDGEEVEGVTFRMENDDAVSTLNRLIEEARQCLAEEEEYCHGYIFEDCKEYFFADTDATDDEIRAWMKEVGAYENEYINEKRYEWLEEEAEHWLNEQRVA